MNIQKTRKVFLYLICLLIGTLVLLTLSGTGILEAIGPIVAVFFAPLLIFLIFTAVILTVLNETSMQNNNIQPGLNKSPKRMRFLLFSTIVAAIVYLAVIIQGFTN